MLAEIWMANAQVKDDAKLERDSLIQTHVKRYEKLFNSHFNKTVEDFAHLPGHIRKYMVIDSLVIAMDALIAKEKVLGLHTRQFRVQLNNFFKKKIVAQYNFGQQEFQDLVRLKELLAKMKTEEQPNVEYFDDLADETKDANIIDVDHIEVNVEASNKIKETTKINKHGNGTPSEIVESLTQKIMKEDLKQHSPDRMSFMEKLKLLNGNGKNGK